MFYRLGGKRDGPLCVIAMEGICIYVPDTSKSSNKGKGSMIIMSSSTILLSIESYNTCTLTPGTPSLQNQWKEFSPFCIEHLVKGWLALCSRRIRLWLPLPFTPTRFGEEKKPPLIEHKHFAAFQSICRTILQTCSSEDCCSEDVYYCNHFPSPMVCRNKQQH